MKSLADFFDELAADETRTRRRLMRDARSWLHIFQPERRQQLAYYARRANWRAIRFRALAHRRRELEAKSHV